MKNKIKFFKKGLAVILTVTVLLVSSCKENSYIENVESLKIIVKQTLGTKLVIPEDIFLYKPFTGYKLDSIAIQKANYKIYTLINASCGTCIRKINYWANFSRELKIPIVLIFRSDDRFELLRYISSSKEINTFPYPFFLDKKSELMNLNKFMKESDDFQTILTDENNTILLMGNPMNSENIKELYLKELQKRLKK